ncbi:M48 family metallopeptidase [Desulfospira joergensenii]|uniref:M48 family metallopeptidase n=1 Tax=Desulfospira joergensenii TaxID=53329 RepID=UPI0003B2F62E|nr:M48 family metallopeptidase [Desulfospira joergensenii]
MFSNFLYFLIALVIYTSSELFDGPDRVNPMGLVYSLALVLAFALVCRFSFQRLEKRAAGIGPAGLDHRINILMSRLSITALAMFALNIYVFRLNLLVLDLSLFKTIPTLAAVLFLGLFLFYLVMIWNWAYGVQRGFFSGGVTKREFIRSNISFCLPALLPWFCLSLFADMIRFLPFQAVKDSLNTTAGEIGYILVFLIVVSVFGPVLIQRLWNCSPLESGLSRDLIERVCRKAGLKYADILKWELFGGTMITAGVMGLVGRFRYILVTPALLNSLEEEEIESVILHEIGHVQRHHMLFYLMFFAGFIACNFVFFEPVMLLLYLAGPLYDGFALLGVEKGNAHALMITAFLIFCFVLYFRFGFGFFMRNFERQADIHVYRFKPDASAMISTFKKIAFLSGQSMDKPNWHHFSIGQRIRFLEKCQTEPERVGLHHNRVKKLILGYLGLVFLVFFAGYSINYGFAREGFSQFITQQVLFQELKVDPDNSDLYVFVGDYHYDKKAYEKAVEAYENVIRIDRENIHALNNLAWLLATCPDRKFRNYEQALDLASRALALKKEAFILDTYAEALFVNNRVDEAILAAKEALAISDSKKSYYQEQVERFEGLQAAM